MVKLLPKSVTIHRDSNRTFFLQVVALVLTLPAVLIWHSNVRAENEKSAGLANYSGSKKELTTAHLYFSDKKNTFLSAEERKIIRPEVPELFGKMIVQALIEGPHTDLMRTVPEKTGIRTFFILDDGTAVVDLTEEAGRHHPGGVQMERLTIFSIVNSLVLNVSEIKKVKFLIGGTDALTLAGHLDLGLPFMADMLLIR